MILTSEVATTSIRHLSLGNVKFCPGFCNCSRVYGNLTVQKCTEDPADYLSHLFMNNIDVSALMIFDSSLSELPMTICSMTKLKWLDISKNELSNLPWGCLKKLRNLQTVVAIGNKIRHLENGSFYDFPSLHTLNLQQNQISSIDIDVFMQVERLKALQGIVLASNRLDSLDSWPIMFAYSSITIDLSYNYIHTFTNQFNYVFHQRTKKTRNTYINLSSNRMTHINDILNGWNFTEIDAFLLIGHMHLDFSKNPFICDCVDYFAYKFLKVIKSKNLALLSCDKPDNLHYRSLLSVPLDDFVCHVNKSCPEECDCVDQPNQLNMIINCQGQGWIHLPKEVPTLPKHNYAYQLNMTYNNITSLDFKSYLGRVRKAFFSHNKISDISIEALIALKHVQLLYLDYNNLKYMPKNITSVNMSGIMNILLQGNEWVCDCHAKETRSWMIQMNRVISDKNGILCSEPLRLKGSNILSLSDHALICGDPPSKEMNAYLGAGGTAIAICLSCICLLIVLRYKKHWFYKKFQWHPFDLDECDGEDKEFDVFVSYANEDEEYVDEYIIPNLKQRGYKVAYHRVNFPGGQPIAVSIEQCILKSKRTLVVFSNNFKASAWCMWEFTVALELDGNKGRHRLVAIKYEDVDLKLLDLTLQAYFKRYTYIEKDSQVFWDNLEYSLPLNKMGDPGDQARDIEINEMNLDNDGDLNDDELDRVNFLPYHN